MAGYIVTYDLHRQGQNYDCLYEKLRAYRTHWHMQRSVWLIDTKHSAEQIFDNLSPCLDENDKLFVGRLSGEAVWTGYSQKVDAWINAHV